MYVMSGEISVTIDGITSTLIKDDLSISFPNALHSLHTSSDSSVLLIIFDSVLADTYTNDLENKKPMHPFLTSNQIHKDLKYCIQALINMDKVLPNYNLIKGYLLIMLSRILERLELVDGSHNDLNLVHRVLLYVDEHYTGPISLDSMARQLNASKFYLSRIFNSKLGTTFNLYVNDKRIKLAEYLLKNSELSVTEISYQSGFDSTRTFYRAFSNNHEITPSEYRKLNKVLIKESI